MTPTEMSEDFVAKLVKPNLVKVPKAGELVAADLRRRIITGELSAGDPLPNEAVLMENFGVSRPTLREAFRILESESIITVLRGAHGGARVLALDDMVAARYTGFLLQYNGTSLADVYRARTELEMAALAMLVNGKFRAAAADRIEQMVQDGVALVGDAEGYAEHEVTMHQTLIELADNRTLGVLARMLLKIIGSHNVVHIATHATEREGSEARAAQRAWTKLVKLLRDGDIPATQAFWRRHLEGVAKYMIGNTEATVVDLLS
ncbi:FadR/GntR family transcriptional regulator [Nocardia sp. alder85J]|uniref:FadR/GntR family transcriptional regulator n=1 Tax=Nocardia sp. alder85J TaxID=2862949 RepID=UPI001CD2F8E7|nr:GntR family transcriptional regulator [Nocardia sp. alder85J]MCX4095754.1 GntR family transcriptional regulator [Nocardia sp. alder85J]